MTIQTTEKTATLPADYDVPDVYPGITPEERVLGFVAWRLVGAWKHWVRRRVESISYETAHTVRRRVSVDLRMLPELMSEPVVLWGDEPIHYIPIAQLRKQRLVRFDLRDEDGRALPLVTTRRNCAITAAMLSAAAQSVAIDRLHAAGIDLLAPDRVGSNGSIDEVPPIRVPNGLERAFWLLAYLNPRASADGIDVSSLAVLDRLGTLGARETVTIDRWQWTLDEEEGCYEAHVRIDDWKALLLLDAAFWRMAYDAARLFMICVPLRYVTGQRRIVKFSYTDYLDQRSTHYPDNPPPTRVSLARRWNRALDRLEGLPRGRPRPNEWTPALDAELPKPVGLLRRGMTTLGWAAQLGQIEAPAVAQAMSYHISVQTPDGIQIRRAELATQGPDDAIPTSIPQRGNQTLRSVNLHVSDPEPGETANAYLYIRPESSLIVRAGFLCAMLTAAALTLVWKYSHLIAEHESAHADAVVAALVVIPGLLTVLATRDTEHPLTTSMVFGVRILAMTPGVLAVLAAGLVVIGDVRSVLGDLLLTLAWFITALLGVAWILAARSRPDHRAL
jgi:hypothetical protein